MAETVVKVAMDLMALLEEMAEVEVMEVMQEN